MGYIDRVITVEHIRRTLSDPAIGRIHFRLGPIVINPSDYQTILSAILTDHMHIHYSAMTERHDAEYSASRDTLEFPIPDQGGLLREYRQRVDLERMDHPREMDRNRRVATEIVNGLIRDRAARFSDASIDPYAEMVIVHECTHAIVDWFNYSSPQRRIQIHSWETEAVSFLAEYIYILTKTNGQANIGDMRDAMVAIATYISMAGYYNIGSNRFLQNEFQQIQNSLRSLGYSDLDREVITNGIGARTTPSTTPTPTR